MCHKKELDDKCLFQSLFAQLKSCYCDYRATYIDESKVQDMVDIAAIFNVLSKKLVLPGRTGIFTDKLQAINMAFNIAIKLCQRMFKNISSLF